MPESQPSAVRPGGPARAGSTIPGLRDLYDGQMNRARDTANARAAHEAVARSAKGAHSLMEIRLGGIWKIEGRDRGLLEMPQGSDKESTHPF